MTAPPCVGCVAWSLQIDIITLPMNINPKILRLTLDPKHIEIPATNARKTIEILKEFTSTTWGKQKEMILATYMGTEEFNNIISSHRFLPLINQPTQETKSSNTIIDNIYCNISCPFDMCDIGIIRPYISDHNAFFCILKNMTLNKITQTCSKRNFSNKKLF